ncbi:hypothetical protein COCCADRAFT_28723 [Bipolaris zeicola 26-R-13]|uniref:Uncharacterized protein n=1 Tax=Cochliobolus carbonum (strain 26-R-13) TaxID=930089 RepID=W6XX93_COCC2|nr:uncharacterized protein COCCADRAFT_28723 [Bipolaris zeicola 26-R-13]EUC30378.1 hypothetical protein COCCADRAFT_28723 [Bipolaris zeicola 26-R-13]
MAVRPVKPPATPSSSSALRARPHATHAASRSTRLPPPPPCVPSAHRRQPYVPWPLEPDGTSRGPGHESVCCLHLGPCVRRAYASLSPPEGPVRFEPSQHHHGVARPACLCGATLDDRLSLSASPRQPLPPPPLCCMQCCNWGPQARADTHPSTVPRAVVGAAPTGQSWHAPLARLQPPTCHWLLHHQLCAAYVGHCACAISRHCDDSPRLARPKMTLPTWCIAPSACHGCDGDCTLWACVALRCGAVVDNRIGKEAYSILLAVYDHILYRA